jgi:uncharacterized protein DUF2190
MSRFDKYDPISGGFRAQLNAAISSGLGTAVGVTINSSGKVVLGASAIGTYRGIIVPDKTFAANQPIDVMTHGEIVEVPTFTAGQAIYIDVATGSLTATSTSNQYVGHMVELGRLIVRLQRTT